MVGGTFDTWSVGIHQGPLGALKLHFLCVNIIIERPARMRGPHYDSRSGSEGMPA